MSDKPQVEPSNYLSRTYNNQARFNSYWKQANEVMEFSPESLLEIGTGNGLLAWYLRRMGLSVVTMDIDERLEPDVVGSVVSIPLQDRSFDAVACFEVLEHVSFNKLPEALSEIERVTRERAFISLPDSKPYIRVSLQLPRHRVVKRLVPLHRPYRKPHVFDGQHHWEIGKDGITVGRVTSEMRRAGFDVEKTCVLFENPYQRFFRLRRKSQP